MPEEGRETQFWVCAGVEDTGLGVVCRALSCDAWAAISPQIGKSRIPSACLRGVDVRIKGEVMSVNGFLCQGERLRMSRCQLG